MLIWAWYYFRIWCGLSSSSVGAAAGPAAAATADAAAATAIATATTATESAVVAATTTTEAAVRWRQNGRDSVSNHQPHDCLLNRLFRRRSKKTSKLRVTGLCAGNSPGTGEFPAQMASYAENVSIEWRHHGRPKHTHRDPVVFGEVKSGILLHETLATVVKHLETVVAPPIHFVAIFVVVTPWRLWRQMYMWRN